MSAQVFGTIVSGDMVESAAERIISAFQGDYLAEVAEQSGMNRGDLPLFRSFPRLLDMSKWDEDQTPSCVIAAPGTLQQPAVKDRKVNVRWALGVGCIVSAIDMPSTLRLCQLYVAAVRTIILQHPSLGGFSNGITFMSERYDEMDSSRNIASGVVQFGVDVLGISDLGQGLAYPSDDATLPTGGWPEVSTVDLDVEKVN